jgi:hypothetical protein
MFTLIFEEKCILNVLLFLLLTISNVSRFIAQYLRQVQVYVSPYASTLDHPGNFALEKELN